jgi:RHS repeat-associated protein
MTDEGRLVPNGSNYDSEYFINDHLGNTRVVVKDSNGTAEVQQESHYYPFGMTMEGMSYQNPLQEAVNKYLYNGKELQDDLGLDWYDYGARFYDAQLARFHVVDRFAEKMTNISPYNYAANNPLFYNEINGDSIWIHYGNNQRAYYENGTLYNSDGSEYDGDNEFVGTVLGFLDQINSVDDGGKLLSTLSGSENNFNFKNVKTKGGYMSFEQNDKGGGDFNVGNLSKAGTSNFKKLSSVAHELFHGYQYEKEGYGYQYEVSDEVEAFVFGASIASKVTGQKPPNLGFMGKIGGIKYTRATSNLIYNGFNLNNYYKALNNFQKGSDANLSNKYFNLRVRHSDPILTQPQKISHLQDFRLGIK